MVELIQHTRALRSWIVDAYDLWWRHGADHVRGGFHERLNHDLTSTGEPRRSRLHPRQAFAYSHAARLRWGGPSSSAVEHALRFFMAHYRREDGLFRALVSPQGRPLNDEIVLYDQAFALLGLAAGYAALGEERWRASGIELHDALRARLAHPTLGFMEKFAQTEPLSSNSHMHLLEATLAWSDLDEDPRWRTLAEEIVEFALTRLIQPRTGALPEFFTADWRLEPDWVVEPGHQFEWAWLLLRINASRQDRRIERTALRLIEIGETHGVHRERRAVIALLGSDFSVRDPHARLWSQCERIKAACSAHALTGAAQYEAMALEAAETLRTYLDTPIRGLWRDRLDAWGSFVEEPAPASSLYHLVGAVLELSRLAERLSSLGAEPTQNIASAGAAPRDLPGGFADR
jgi:mannose-6-phosphate isomerase